MALEFVAFLLGGINFITTAMNSRAPGMKLYDIPMVVWMIVVASILFMALGRAADRRRHHALHGPEPRHRLLRPGPGGDPILWQHLFWFFGHPEVYVVLLPAMGITAEVITTFARKKLFAYKTVLYTAFGPACCPSRCGRTTSSSPASIRAWPTSSRSRRCSSRFRSPR